MVSLNFPVTTENFMNYLSVSGKQDPIFGLLWQALIGRTGNYVDANYVPKRWIRGEKWSRGEILTICAAAYAGLVRIDRLSKSAGLFTPLNSFLDELKSRAGSGDEADIKLTTINHTHTALQSAIKAEFRSISETTVTPPSLPILPIKDIIAVGAYLPNPVTGKFCPRDEIWLAAALDLCKKSGIPTDPRLNVTPVNLIYGNDFLKHPGLRADLVVVCFVIDSTSENGRKIANDPRSFNDGCVSNAHSPTAWQNAVRNTGARFVTTCRTIVPHELQAGMAMSGGWHEASGQFMASEVDMQCFDGDPAIGIRAMATFHAPERATLVVAKSHAVATLFELSPR
ncbi:MAG: hypothetical protein EB059_00235 [Alphaproteobacteria bacterium]|nr:hypothetical protein [Alphaproteobacteria bacterium]